MLRKTCLLLLVLILIPCISHAETKIIFADHKYVMGDNDSKNDARRMCFLEAKRKVLEKAGTYIESHTQTKNFQLTKDEINSYAAALLKIETVKEDWKSSGENMAVFMTVKAEVDTGYIEKQLAKIKKDTSVQKKIKDQQARLQELEHKFIVLQKQLGKVDSSKALVLRKERKEVFDEIDAIGSRYQEVIHAYDDKKIASIRLAKRMLNHVEMGMSVEEVEYILGKPKGVRDRKPLVNPMGATISDGKYSLLYGNFSYRSSFQQKAEASDIDYRGIIIKSWGYNILKSKRPSGYMNSKREIKLLEEYVLGEKISFPSGIFTGQ